MAHVERGLVRSEENLIKTRELVMATDANRTDPTLARRLLAIVEATMAKQREALERERHEAAGADAPHDS